MATVLLVIIYMAFIGMGMPHSLIGAAWPAIYTELALPVSWVSIVTTLISGCTVIASIFSGKVINRFGTGKVAAFSTGLAAISLLGYSMTNGFVFICIMSIPLGLGAGAIDAGLNNYIALHYKASHMNFLHCFYGVGASASPLLISLALADGNWRAGYRYAFLVMAGITLMLVLSLPVWKKREMAAAASAHEQAAPESCDAEVFETAQVQQKNDAFGLKDIIRMPQIWVVWIIMVATNAIEYACGTWGSTYLVEARGVLPQNAAEIITLFYVGMALGRFLSGAISGKIQTWKRIFISIGLVLVSVAVLALPFGPTVSLAGFFLVGLGNGSIYPNFIYMTPYNFGEEKSQAVMGTQIAAAYSGVLLTPPVFGVVAGLAGIQAFPVFLLVLFLIMTAFVFIFVKQLKKSGKYNVNV